MLEKNVWSLEFVEQLALIDLQGCVCVRERWGLSYSE